MPILNIDVSAIHFNLNTLLDICKQNSLEFVPVIKSFSGVSNILEILDCSSIKTLGLSRLSTVNQVSKFRYNPLLTCISLVDQDRFTEAFFQFDEVYVSSEVALSSYISLAKSNPHKNIRLIFLVDCGDHREGLDPNKVYDLIAKHCKSVPHNLQIAGLATTLGCNYGVLPNEENLAVLESLSKRLELLLEHRIDTISVGGSVILKMILDNRLPSFITQVRIGEALLLGTIPAYSMDHPSLRQDAFSFSSSVVELDEKPNYPSFSQGLNALGKEYKTEAKRVILQGILDFGILDTDANGLSPKNANIKFCNQNSDYTMIEVYGDPKALPKHICFRPNYKSLAQALHSDFVEKKIVPKAYSE
ncbi:MAG: alanine racemase [Candidatus Cloacimonetes bacterium]|nr:alanine racemase [Candidatus Cloacimonadota bacterium]